MKLLCRGSAYSITIHQNSIDKPYLALMHGFMGSSKGFEILIKQIRSMCNPCTIDLAGHGESQPFSNDPKRYRAESQVLDLISIFDRLQIEHVWLYGYSMGGRLAQNLILDSPERFKGIILESTHCGISDTDEREARQAVDESRARDIEQNFDLFIEKWTALPLFKPPKHARPFDYKSINETQIPAAMAASLRGFGAGSAPFVCDRMRELTKPVGMIAGESDKKFVDKMREMHHLFHDSKLLVATGAGHRVHADQPQQIATFLTHFFKTYG